MTITDVIQALNAKVLTDHVDYKHPIETVCGSDMMSDVLAFVKKDALLLTGLNNLQVMRTAEMLDIVCVVFIRGKIPSDAMLGMAEDLGIHVLACEDSMFEACGKLYEAGFRGGMKIDD